MPGVDYRERDGGGGGGGIGPGIFGLDTPGGTGPGTTPATPGTVAPFNSQQFFPTLPSGDRKSLENLLLQISAATANMDAGQRNAIFSLLFPALIPLIQGGGEGFRPDELATMRGNVIDTTATQFGGAQSSLKDMLRRRGLFTSGSPMAGEAVRDIALLNTEQAKATSGGLRGVDLVNAQQRISNLFNAMNIAGGHAANPASDISAGASVANALQNEPGSLWRSILGSLTGAAASSAGTALGTALGNIFRNRNRTNTTPSTGTMPPIGGVTGGFGTGDWENF